MKTKLSACLCIVFSSMILKAQNLGNPRDSINFFYSMLNQNEIAYNILLDKAYSEIDLSEYGATNTIAAACNNWMTSPLKFELI